MLTERWNLDRTEDIGPEIGKMCPGDGRCLRVGQIRPESNVEILFGETAVAGQNRPDQQTEKLPQHEAYRDWEQPDERNQNKSQQIEQTIHE